MKTKHGFFTIFFSKLLIPKGRNRGAWLPPVLMVLLVSPAGRAVEESLTPPFARRANVIFTEFNTGYYYTDKNYLDISTSQSLYHTLGLKTDDSAPFFHYMNMDLSMGYSFASWFSAKAFFSGFWFAQSGNGKGLKFSGPQIKRAGGAFYSDQKVASFFGFIPEFSASFPFFAVNQHTEYPITDDGSIHITPGLWLYGVIKNTLYPFVYTGFKFRTLSLSSYMQWKAGIMFKTRIAEVGAYSYGLWSVIRDTSSSRLGDKYNLLKRTNAGSLRFYSTNPGLIGFVGWLGWHFPYVTLRLSGDIDINGTRHSKGYGFLASLIIHFGVGKKKVENIFDKPGEGEDFEPQIIRDDSTVQTIFENPAEDALMRQAEEELQEAEQAEEQKTTTE